MTGLTEIARAIDRDLLGQMEDTRRTLAALRQDRRRFVSELYAEVGGTRAAAILEISRSAVYKILRDS